MSERARVAQRAKSRYPEVDARDAGLRQHPLDVGLDPAVLVEDEEFQADGRDVSAARMTPSSFALVRRH